jgi:trehalose 6-phosphate synthase/phosphatase
MSRVILVSNRLPATVSVVDGRAEVRSSSGGLAVGLGGLHERNDTLWIGWPGDTSGLAPEESERMRAELAERRIVPVEVSGDQVARFYDGFSNSVLWPLFHYQVQPMPVDAGDFEPYEAVNRRFAEAVISHWRPGDRIWVHDYQLLAVPAMIRERLPEARIGFFLHIPFPSSELFRMLPQRHALLEGMLGADLIGFHTATYLRHFVATVLRVVGATARVDRVEWQGREVHLGVFPMGVDTATFAGTADEPAVLEEVAALREGGQVRLVVGIDRLDYTKGIPGRLLAFERLLQKHPELVERVRLVQVAVPSRKDVDAYQEFRRRADELIGRIQGAFATARWVPIHWLYRGLSRQEVVALYRAADVMLVTPIRDGMNLVAKEFVASRSDEDGVLVLSEFAGAAAEMAEAVLVNPFDVDGTADAIHRALSMPSGERRERMRSLRRRVLTHDIERWWNGFLSALDSVAIGPACPVAVSPPAMIDVVTDELREAPRRIMLLDYDGTLVPYASIPSGATPDAELLELLCALAAAPGNDVHVVSGRGASSLGAWLGDLPITLHAEHGFATRAPGGTWSYRTLPSDAWRVPVLEILEDFRRRTPGSLVELKRAGMAWHYRMADPEFGPLQAKELHLHLSEILSNLPVEILPGVCVIEVRPHGLDKGTIVSGLRRSAPEGAAFLAMGDDSTDEQMVAALPPSSIAIHVGPGPSRASMRLADVASARAFLRRLLGADAEVVEATPPACLVQL